MRYTKHTSRKHRHSIKRTKLGVKEILNRCKHSVINIKENIMEAYWILGKVNSQVLLILE